MSLKSAKTPTYEARELHPSSGEPNEAHTSDMALITAKRVATFDTIWVSGNPYRLAHSTFEDLRQMGLEGSNQRQLGVRCTGPSGIGKTTCFLRYQALIERTVAVEPGQRLVIHLPLERGGTPKGLFVGLLEAYGDDYAHRGTEAQLRARAYKAIEHFGTQLIGIDEVQHLATRTRATNDVTDTLKRLLDRGRVPLALLGTEASRGFLENNLQLSNRLLPPVDLNALDPTSGPDRERLTSFLRRFDQELVAKELCAEPSGLDDPRTVTALFTASSGVLGRVANILRIAMMVSTRRSAAFIEPHDLATAVQRWAVAQNVVRSNPFVRS